MENISSILGMHSLNWPIWYASIAYRSHHLISISLALLFGSNVVVAMGYVAKHTSIRIFPQALRGPLSKIPTNWKLTGALLFSLIAGSLSFASTFEPYRLYEKPEALPILIFPTLEITDDGWLAVTKSSELFQSEIAKQLPLENGGDFDLKIVERGRLPFRDYKLTTLANLIEKVETENSSFYYLITVKRGDSFERIDIGISPKGRNDDPRTRKFLETTSQTLSLFSNQYQELPQATIAQLTGGILFALTTQSMNTLLIDNGLFDTAQKNIEASVKQIRALRLELGRVIGPSRNEDINRLLDETETAFLKYRKNIMDGNFHAKANVLFERLVKNPFGSFQDEHRYMAWLVKQEGFDYYGRLIPVGGWIRFDSELEHFVGYVSVVNPKELPFKRIREQFDRMLPGDSWVKNYYLSIVAFLRNERNEMVVTSDEFAKNNTLAPQFSEKERMIILAIDNIKGSPSAH